MIMEKMELSEFGTFLGTRELGKKIKEKIETKLLFEPPVVVDFNGINGITNSFADECFGKLMMEIGQKPFVDRIKFSNLDPTEKSILNFVLHNRNIK